MCGIIGALSINYVNLDEGLQDLGKRGPDNQSFKDLRVNDTFVSLGHTRLSIIDLNNSANQPMETENSIVVFNGEIYNYLELRRELEAAGKEFITESDTEVLLLGFEYWGEQVVHCLEGMFAAVIVDKFSGKFFVCRDRVGVKPLYYCYNNYGFYFASEIQALRKILPHDPKISNDSLELYFSLGYIPAPYSIYSEIKKFPQGHFAHGAIGQSYLDFQEYWYPNTVRRNLGKSEAKEELKKLLIKSFESRMIADVPVGIFLSGGYDSSAVVALLRERYPKKVLNTFSIGFTGLNVNNEAPQAAQIASLLNTEHTEMYCNIDDAKEIVPQLPHVFGEPFADSSAIPTLLVSKLARQKVTVALSGDGGDELFLGYNSYDHLNKHYEKLKLLTKLPAIVIFLVGKVIPRGRQKIKTLLYNLAQNKSRLRELLLDAYFQKNHGLVLDVNENFSFSKMATKRDSNTSFLEFAAKVDFRTYLPDDILVKVDRCTMWSSLEGREPFLGTDVIEFVMGLPEKLKYGTRKKLILRELVEDYIPKKIIDKKKRGFSVPIREWLDDDFKLQIIEMFTDLREDTLINSKNLSLLESSYQDNSYDEQLIWRLFQYYLWKKAHH